MTNPEIVTALNDVGATMLASIGLALVGGLILTALSIFAGSR